MVVGELRVGAGLHHAGEHASRLPSERPAVVGQRVADGVIGDRLAADGRDLVLPVGIVIGVEHHLRDAVKRGRQRVRRAQVARHVAAAIVQVHRGLAANDLWKSRKQT